MAPERADRVVDLLERIEGHLAVLAAAVRQKQPKAVADDRDLDGAYGDPLLRFKVRDWTGPDCKGQTFSQCPPDLLDLVAESLDYFADQSERNNEVTSNGKPVAPFRRKDAARARGWAKRIREGRHVVQEADSPGFDDPAPHDDEAPFSANVNDWQVKDIKW